MEKQFQHSSCSHPDGETHRWDFVRTSPLCVAAKGGAVGGQGGGRRGRGGGRGVTVAAARETWETSLPSLTLLPRQEESCEKQRKSKLVSLFV